MPERGIPSARRDGQRSFLLRQPDRQPTYADEARFSRAMRGHRLSRLGLEYCEDDVICSLADLRWRTNLLLDRVRYPELGGPARANFDFLTTCAMDGIARLEAGELFVGLSFGLVRAVYATAHALARGGEFEPPGSEASPPTPDPEVARAVAIPRECASEAIPCNTRLEPPSAVFASITSPDVERRWFAHSVAAMFLAWSAYHEWAHHFAGHLGWLSTVEGVGVAALREFGDVQAVDPDIGQLMEFEADRIATWRIASEILTPPGFVMDAVKTTVPEAQRLRAWLRIAVVMFAALGEQDQAAVVGRRLLHPHPEVRFWCVYSRARQEVAEKRPELLGEYDAEVRESFRLVRRMNQACGREQSGFTLSRADPELVIAEHDRLNAAVASELHPLTRPYGVVHRMIAEAGGQSQN
ncbi:MAG: hypothetical protein IT457_20500 [Planctomycetes bacterium]|nr:hypothetical protein [Planctomycetota bacterium]